FHAHYYLHSFPTRRSSDLFPLVCERAALHPLLFHLRYNLQLTKYHKNKSGQCNPFDYDKQSAPDVCKIHTHENAESPKPYSCFRSEEHTSELQSRENLVCR